MGAPLFRKVLLIDDNDDARELLGMVLELRGHCVATAGSGPAGLECAAAFSPELDSSRTKRA
jgi:CheY-like chemotaxis protein